MSHFLHITTRTDWEQAATDGEYRPARRSMGEGFIHQSIAHHVGWKRPTSFSGGAGLVLLVI
jgi:uncharacterized protein (DUF952 family)